MPMIDADTHVDECEETWKKLEGTPCGKYIPVTVSMPPDEAKRAGYNATTSRCWVVEGRLQNRAIRDEVNHPPRLLRELQDVPGRVAHMDKMGVDVQVIFPTFFIRYNTSNAEAEWALTTTYNRWLAEKCAPTNGRLRWAAVLPLLRPDKAVEELRWAKEHGACGIFKRGFDLDRKVTDPHFFPIYEEASALELSLCIHTGHPLPGHEWDRGFPIMYSFTELVSSGIAKKFPKLRFGLIESGASCFRLGRGPRVIAGGIKRMGHEKAAHFFAPRAGCSTHRTRTRDSRKCLRGNGRRSRATRRDARAPAWPCPDWPTSSDS